MDIDHGTHRLSSCCFCNFPFNFIRTNSPAARGGCTLLDTGSEERQQLVHALELLQLTADSHWHAAGHLSHAARSVTEFHMDLQQPHLGHGSSRGTAPYGSSR